MSKFLIRKTVDGVLFPAVINFGVAAFMVGESLTVPHTEWLMLIAPVNLTLAATIIYRNWDLLTGNRKENPDD